MHAPAQSHAMSQLAPEEIDAVADAMHRYAAHQRAVAEHPNAQHALFNFQGFEKNAGKIVGLIGQFVPGLAGQILTAIAPILTSGLGSNGGQVPQS